jgi:hypothetical protein
VNEIDSQVSELGESQRDSQIKQKIYEKVRRRMAELGFDSPFHSNAAADIIVIPDDKTLLFEPQNSRASKLLSQRCGSSLETFSVKEVVRVHPVGSHKIIAELTVAGLKVTTEIQEGVSL